MAKREEAGSGLRAGFISEEEALRKKQQAEDETPGRPRACLPKATQAEKEAKEKPKADTACGRRSDSQMPDIG